MSEVGGFLFLLSGRPNPLSSFHYYSTHRFFASPTAAVRCVFWQAQGTEHKKLITKKIKNNNKKYQRRKNILLCLSPLKSSLLETRSDFLQASFLLVLEKLIKWVSFYIFYPSFELGQSVLVSTIKNSVKLPPHLKSSFFFQVCIYKNSESHLPLLRVYWGLPSRSSLILISFLSLFPPWIPWWTPPFHSHPFQATFYFGALDAPLPVIQSHSFKDLLRTFLHQSLFEHQEMCWTCPAVLLPQVSTCKNHFTTIICGLNHSESYTAYKACANCKMLSSTWVKAR